MKDLLMKISMKISMKNFICKLNKKYAGKNRGMTMVEVMMGFTILVLMLGMLSGIIASANNIFYNAVDLKKEGEKLQRVIYMKDVTEGQNEALKNTKITFVPDSKMPGSHDEIEIQANIYKIGSNSLLPSEEASENELFIYFIEKVAKTNAGD